MEEQSESHQTSKKSLKIVKYVMIGISLLTFLSAFSMPWGAYTKKETSIAIASLIFVNVFVFWTYKLIFVWKRHFIEKLELKNDVKIVPQIGGAFKVTGNASFFKKLTVHLQIFLYFGLGMIFPLAVGIGVIYLIDASF